MAQAGLAQRNAPPPLGLTSREAAMRKQQGLGNSLPKGGDHSLLGILRRNVLTAFNGLNLVLAGLLFFVGSYRNMLFMGVVVSNTLIGVVQELRAKRMLDRLRLLSEGEYKALRDGQDALIPCSELVKGDVIRLSRGEQVPGDGEILQGSCQADESLLTGESEPIGKGEGDRLLSGSFLTEGEALTLLTAVGEGSYAGGLQMAARKMKRPRSKLMEDLGRIIRRVSVVILPLGLLLFWRHMAGHGMGLADSVTRTVAATLGMIPEGLMLLTSLALTLGVLRLGRQGALVNELYGIESLARTDVVCMDKTGTLTSGRMRLAELLPLGGHSQAQTERAARAWASAQPEGDRIAGTLLSGIPKEREAPAIVNQVPFSSMRKWSAVTISGPEPMTLVSGAPERLLAGVEEALALARERAGMGLRVLALMQTDAPLSPAGAGREPELPDGLLPLGLICLEDELRPQVQDTVRYFGEQGVTVKIITGDNPLTAVNIAKQAGVPLADDWIDLSDCPKPVDYADICEAYTIFARVSPEDKRELVKALKAKGHGVAMVGDGVNDIPALKAADCSIAMKTGHSAACRVAEITLLNADFALLPQIVAEGRRVIHNITRTAALFLVKNIFSFLLTASLLALPFVYPFAPVQLTLVSSLTIGIPSFFLAFQPSGERVRGNFLGSVLQAALPGGLCVWLLTLSLLALEGPLGMSREAASTLCTVAAGYSGLWMLLRACLPLNVLRGTLVTVMAVLFGAAAVGFGWVFGFVGLSQVEWWCLEGVGVACPIILSGIARGALLFSRLGLGRTAGA